LRGSARGLTPWATTRLDVPGRTPIEITATPCRHGPPLSRPLAGDVVGFALRWDGQEHGVLWISGDTVLHDGVRQVADRLEVHQRAADRALEGAKAVSGSDAPPGSAPAVALTGVRQVATDLMVFAGVNLDDAVEAVREGTLEQRVAAPARAPRQRFGWLRRHLTR
jgi:hypothetical protein